MFKCMIHVNRRSFIGFGPTVNLAKEAAEKDVERNDDIRILRLSNVSIEVGPNDGWTPDTIIQKL